MRTVPKQFNGAPEALLIWPGRHHVDLAARLQRKVCCTERSRAHSRLDDGEAVGEPHDQPVSRHKEVTLRRDPGLPLAYETTPLQQRLSQRFMPFGVDHVEAVRQHGDAHSRSRDRRTMRLRVHPYRQTADYCCPGSCQIVGDTVGKGQASLACLPGAYDGDRWAMEGATVSLEEEHRRGIVHLLEQRREVIVLKGDEPGPDCTGVGFDLGHLASKLLKIGRAHV